MVLGWAALLRLGWPGNNLFDFDQAQVSLLALRMARAGEVARLGMVSSTGFPNLPAAVWIFALPYALSTDPLIASLFVGILGTLAVLGLWWLVRPAWGAGAAFTAALLFATTPFAVFYSRDIWAQDLLLPLTVAWALAGVYGIAKGSSWTLAVHFFLVAVTWQVHFAGLVLVPATGWLVFRYRLWKYWWAMLVGGITAGALAVPFAYVVWCCEPGARAALAAAAQTPAQVSLASTQLLGSLAVGYNWEWLLVGPDWHWGPAMSALLAASRLLTGGAMVCGGVLLARPPAAGAAPANNWPAVLAGLLPAWAVAAPLMFLVHKGPVQVHYQLAALPAFFVAAGAGYGWLRHRAGRVGWVGAVLGVATVSTLALVQIYGAVGRQAWPGGLRTPLAFPRAAALAVQDGQRVVVHAHGNEPAVIGEVAAFEVLLWGYPHQMVDGRSALLLPAGPAHLLMLSDDLAAAQTARALAIPGSIREFPRRLGESPLQVLTLAQADIPLTEFHLTGFPTLQNGARLYGWQARAEGDTFRLYTLWQIVGDPPGTEYHQFHHLTTADFSNVIQVSDVDASAAAWRRTDWLLVWADFDPPPVPGEYFVGVGMYAYPSLERSPVLDAADPLAPIRLGPIAWPLE